MFLKKVVSASTLATVIAIITTACTTANYGLAPSPVQDKQDTFSMKVYVGGWAAGETSDAAVKDDIEVFQKSKGYKGYKVLDKRYNLIPSYFEYTIQFYRD